MGFMGFPPPAGGCSGTGCCWSSCGSLMGHCGVPYGLYGVLYGLQALYGVPYVLYGVSYVVYEVYGVPYGVYGVPLQVAVRGRAAAGAAVGALWGTMGCYGVPYELYGVSYVVYVVYGVPYVVYELYGMLYGIYGVPPPPRWLFRDGLLPEQLWVVGFSRTALSVPQLREMALPHMQVGPHNPRSAPS